MTKRYMVTIDADVEKALRAIMKDRISKSVSATVRALIVDAYKKL